MILRKRAWDIMQEEFASVSEYATLAEVMKVLWDWLRETPENHIVVVKTETGGFKGVVTAWDVLQAVEDFVFEGETMRSLQEADLDKVFSRACALCSGIEVEKIMHTNVPVVKPNDPLLIVLDALADTKRNWAVVAEGGKVIGVILIGDLYREVTRDIVTTLDEE